VEILWNDDKTIANPAPDIYKYNIWVTGGVKIDISGGIFLTSLMNKEYETKDDTGVNKFIYEKNKGNYDFGFGSSINISLRKWVMDSSSIGYRGIIYYWTKISNNDWVRIDYRKRRKNYTWRFNNGSYFSHFE
jgi:hypothetical protein